MRGEQYGVTDNGVWRAGSSPRARRAGQDRCAGSPGLGIIPACAGSRTSPAGNSARKPDHPRVRGEQRSRAAVTSGSSGSSPRARGADAPRRRHAGRHRIIPACAGSSAARSARPAVRRDQPRVRGEQGYTHWGTKRWNGSAPRARGAVRPWRVRLHGHGISPACAGSSPPPSGAGSENPDQPRVRGEQFLRFSGFASQSGSAPRARGAGVPLILDPRSIRISPACAGSSRSG